MDLVSETEALLVASSEAAAILGIELRKFANFPDLAGAVLGSIVPATTNLISRVYAQDAALVEQSIYDITETARRNFEPGGAAATLLFARGVHAMMVHRVAHKLWQDGDDTLALAVKSSFERVLSTDIHPAAQIGAGLWLDHGLGFVVGETCIIGEDVSIWHNVTLGSTLTDSGAQRHPTVGDGAVIGAGAIILGDISIGAGANVAAGAIVLDDVPPDTVFVGSKAKAAGAAKVSFTQKKRAKT